MTTIMPDSEQLRKAVHWISEQRQDSPEKPVSVWIDAACLKFNLSPKEAQYLTRLLTSTPGDSEG